MKYARQICKSLLIIFGVVGLVFSMFQIFQLVGSGYIDDIKPIDSAKSIYASRIYMSDSNYIYSCSEQKSQLQIFSGQGDFIKGFSLPSKGGAIWSGLNERDEMVIYCVRSNYKIIFNDDEYIKKENTFYVNSESFYETEQIVNKKPCKLKGNKVYYGDSGIIDINAPRSYISVELCILIYVASLMCILLTTGLLKKLLDSGAKSANKTMDKFLKYHKRLK